VKNETKRDYFFMGSIVLLAAGFTWIPLGVVGAAIFIVTYIEDAKEEIIKAIEERDDEK